MRDRLIIMAGPKPHSEPRGRRAGSRGSTRLGRTAQQHILPARRRDDEEHSRCKVNGDILVVQGTRVASRWSVSAARERTSTV